MDVDIAEILAVSVRHFENYVYSSNFQYGMLKVWSYVGRNLCEEGQEALSK